MAFFHCSFSFKEKVVFLAFRSPLLLLYQSESQEEVSKLLESPDLSNMVLGQGSATIDNEKYAQLVETLKSGKEPDEENPMLSGLEAKKETLLGEYLHFICLGRLSPQSISLTSSFHHVLIARL